MKKVICIVLYGNWEHLSQIITGYILFSKKHKYHVKFFKKYSNEPGQPLLKVIIDGKVIIYDCADGYCDFSCLNKKSDLMYNLLQECDFYFKRSFKKQTNEQYYADSVDKIYPLGLNFNVTCLGNPLNFRYISWKQRIKKLLKYFLFLDFPYFEFIFFSSKFPNKWKILFYTRLWHFDSEHESMISSSENITNHRILMIRTLSSTFSNQFVGGLEQSDYSVSVAPDLVLKKCKTRKIKYLREMKKAGICIATTGLHDSIGWKFAEYLASGKIIVSEPLYYELPGDFHSGWNGNYFEYHSPEEAIQIIRSIQESDDKKIQMMLERNYAYYQQYISPLGIVESSLKVVFQSK